MLFLCWSWHDAPLKIKNRTVAIFRYFSFVSSQLVSRFLVFRIRRLRCKSISLNGTVLTYSKSFCLFGALECINWNSKLLLYCFPSSTAFYQGTKQYHIAKKKVFVTNIFRSGHKNTQAERVREKHPWMLLLPLTEWPTLRPNVPS